MEVWSAGSWVEGRYRLERELGRGGLGVTWLATDALAERQVALKCLLQPTAERLAMLRAEFLALRGLVHPHLTRVHDFSIGEAYFSSQFVDGLPIDRWAAAQVHWPAVLPALRQLLEALAFLHSTGFRHGDVKAANVLVDRQGMAVLIDLSCGAPLGMPAEAVAGTPGTIAPEVLRQEMADERADLFAFGKLLGRLLSGRAEENEPSWQRLVERLTAAVRGQRPAHAGEVLEALGGKGFELPHRLAPPAQLLGRQKEMQTFEAAWQAVRQGNSGVRGLWLHGAPGCGSSRLLQEMKWQATLQAPVFEALGVEPIQRLLQRACGDATQRCTVADLWRWRQQLVDRPPCVLLVDDVDRLQGVDRGLLLALWRGLESDERFVLLCASHQLPPCLEEAHAALPLAPLKEPEVRIWLQGSALAEHATAVWQWSGGYPAVLQGGLQQGWSGGSLEALQRTFAAATRLTAAEVALLSVAAQRALRLLAASEASLAEADLLSAGVMLTTLSRLQQDGFLVTDELGWRLSRQADAAVVQQATPVDLWCQMHAWLADLAAKQRQHSSLSAARRSHLTAREAMHRAQAGQTEAALQGLQAATAVTAIDGVSWQRAAERIATCDARPATWLLAATLLQELGRVDRALYWLAKAWRLRPTGELRRALQEQLIRCLLRHGDGRRAERWLQGLAEETTPSTVALPQLAEWRARAAILRGDYARARLVAKQALAEPAAIAPTLRAALHDAIGLAASYLGDPREAQQQLEQAAALHRQHSDDPTQIRNLSYAAFNAYRAGDGVGAAQRYRQALQLAEEAALPDLITSGALNLGTACHQQGDWGEAWEAYQRALRMARALGRSGTQINAAFNLAKLCLDLGANERAATLLGQVERAAAAADKRFFLAACQAMRGELAAAAGNQAEAIRQLQLARQAFVREGAKRERLEVDLLMVELELRGGASSEASVRLAVLQATEEDAAEDLRVELQRLIGMAQTQRGETAAGLATLEAAAEDAHRLQRRALEARCRTALAEAYAAQQATTLAQQSAAEARALWERIAASLPAALRETFWLYAERCAVQAKAETAVSGDDLRLWQRLVAINRRLNSSLKLQEVLEMTVDAALELTGAERGFVLLRCSGNAPLGKRRKGQALEDLEVRVARRMGNETQDDASQEFSRGIAEQVLRSGTPIITTDASSDARFGDQASVHALRLQSVVAVPIHAADQLVGALYADSRLQRGHFTSAELPLLAAFADQVALALRNAHLHEQLQQRSRELEVEQRRVESLLRGQAQQIDSLQTQLRWQQRTLEHRYRDLIGSSPAMQRVFATLDRVADLHINVLLSGESGTGKEMVARAIHFGSSRKDKPLVSVNCAALPETLLESELFGHVRGAFTGAERDRIGLVAQAHGGTLFLDELGEMPLAMQAKLLRVLQEREVRPVGSSRSTPIDVRLLCATNRRLREEVEAGRFREDLYYRIAVLEIELPPLRQRLAELAEHLLARAAKSLGKPPARLTSAALRELMKHRWPGNVRELDNVLTKALAFAQHEDRIDAADLQWQSSSSESAPPQGSRADFALREAERIQQALQEHDWNVSEVARALAIPRATLYRKLRRYKLLER